MAKPTKGKSSAKRVNPASHPLAKYTPEQLGDQFKKLYAQNNLTAALNIASYATKVIPMHPKPWADASVCCIGLEKWQDAIKYGTKALQLAPQDFSVLDSLSHAHNGLRQWDKVRVYGKRALELRDAKYSTPPVIAWDIAPTPVFNTTDRSKNIIAFCLFGQSSKYCETSILNAIDQPSIYPHWTCRFYVDESVPEHIITRMRENGADVRLVPEHIKHWPKPMWRFFAYDDPTVERVIFRDADSVISTREASAVNAWIESNQQFHMMRDIGSHTELILAGMWGTTRGALPNMTEMVELFLQKPVESQHFADQYFLREFVWPYAKQHLIQHDSMFGFMNAQPFPEGEHTNDFHVGYCEGSVYIAVPTTHPENSTVQWRLIDTTTQPETEICAYPALVQAGEFKANLPRRYALRLNGNGWIVRVDESPVTL